MGPRTFRGFSTARMNSRVLPDLCGLGRPRHERLTLWWLASAKSHPKSSPWSGTGQGLKLPPLTHRRPARDEDHRPCGTTSSVLPTTGDGCQCIYIATRHKSHTKHPADHEKRKP